MFVIRCTSDVRCPHAVTGKLPLMWDELETVIDDVLHQFDRRAVKKFLKRDIDGNTKNNLGTAVKEVTQSFNKRFVYAC